MRPRTSRRSQDLTPTCLDASCRTLKRAKDFFAPSISDLGQPLASGSCLNTAMDIRLCRAAVALAESLVGLARTCAVDA